MHEFGFDFTKEESRRFDSICDLGVRYGNGSDVTPNKNMTAFEKWTWELGAKEARWMQEHQEKAA